MLSIIKTLAIIYYIKNYVVKNDYCQYQKIMTVIIVRKTFKDFDIKLSTTNILLRLDKFILKIFN